MAPQQSSSWELSTGQQVGKLVQALHTHATTVRSDAALLAEALSLSGAPHSLTGLQALVQAGELLSRPHSPGPMLLDEPDWSAVERTATALLKTGRECEGGKQALVARYREELFQLELPALSSRLRRWSGAFFLLAWWMLRGVRKALRGVRRDASLPKNRVLLADVERAMEIEQQTRELDGANAVGERLFGSRWLLPDRDWEELARTLVWSRGFRPACAALRGFIPGGATMRPSEALANLRSSSPARVVEATAVLSTALQRFVNARTALARAVGLREEAAFGAPGDERYLDRVIEQTTVWLRTTGQLRGWHRYVGSCVAAHNHGLAPLVQQLQAGACTAAEVVPMFERAFHQAWTQRAIAADPALQSFYGAEHDRHVARFAEMDRTLLALSRQVTASRVCARAPRPTGQTADSSEIGILLREVKKQRRHLPIRVLFQKIPNLLPRLKPCLMMSPLSVAQYLDPNGEPFDLVVFDEASQIPTHDAIGAIARGNKAIVVGDSRQLPPTSFFQQSDDPDAEPDEDDFQELESILDECVAARVPEKTLDWHYRSRHETLIAFSNYHYYDNRLNTFPSAIETVAHLGVSMRTIDGHYDRAKSRTNRAEAEAVVAEIVRRLRDPKEAERSIGVVTFSKAQQSLVEDLLDKARRDTPALEKYFDEDQIVEPVIIKNLENIQGDERDVMLFSICYGPDLSGKVAMNFGPLNRDGGERRLNVAITRAREQLIVFSTLRSHQIDLGRTRSVGVRDLKTFLDYAQRGPIAIAESLVVDGDLQFDSPFEEEVHSMLRERGWNVHTQVGCAGYRIDLGVIHPDEPGRFVLGIECDGAYYHSAKSARDRDRLRSEVLGRLGWRLHRIWSTDWWLDPTKEIEKAEAAIREAMKNLPNASPAASNAEPPEPTPAPEPAAQPEPPAPRTQQYASPPTHAAAASEPRASYAAALPTAATAAPLPSEDAGQTYQCAPITPSRHGQDDAYERRFEFEFRDLIAQVIATEAPISTRLLARRVAPYWSVQRATKRFEKRVLSVFRLIDGTERPHFADGFVWRAGQTPRTYSTFRVPDDGDPSTQRKPDEIPVEEVANAARHVLQANLGMATDDLARETARILGFSRMGGNVVRRMSAGIDYLVQQNLAKVEGAQIALP